MIPQVLDERSLGIGHLGKARTHFIDVLNQLCHVHCHVQSPVRFMLSLLRGHLRRFDQMALPMARHVANEPRLACKALDREHPLHKPDIEAANAGSILNREQPVPVLKNGARSL